MSSEMIASIQKEKENKNNPILSEYFNGQAIEDLPLSYQAEPTFNEAYEYISVFGKGSFGIVIKAVEKNTGDYCAIKIIKKDKSNESKLANLREEVSILQSLNNKHIVTFKGMHESCDYIYIVMEQLSGGSLTELVKCKSISKQSLTDDECSTIIRSTLESIKYIHSCNYIHRDLKPDNLMFQSNDLSSLKIVDFGLGVKFVHNSSITKNCGTLLYMPLEQAKSLSYGSSVDIWACGMIMYYALAGKHPLFEHGDNEELYLMKLSNPHWVFPSHFSPLAIDFFKRMCNASPILRYDAMQALKHPWITRINSDPIPRSLQEEQDERNAIEQFKKIILSFKFSYVYYKQAVPPEYHNVLDFIYMSPESIKVTKFDDFKKYGSLLISKSPVDDCSELYNCKVDFFPKTILIEITY